MNATNTDKIALSVFHISIFAVGFPGNLLVLIAFGLSKDFRRRPSNVCLVFLTIGDFLTTLFAPPYYASGLIAKHFDRSKPEFFLRLCKVTIFALTTTGITRIFSFTAMSVERFIAIVYPYLYTKHCTRKKVYVAAVFIWVHAMLSTLPAVLVEGWLEYYASNESICKFTSKPESIVYTAPMVMFNFAIPTVTVILMNVRVFWIARGQLRTALKEKEQFCRLCAQAGDEISAIDSVIVCPMKNPALDGSKTVPKPNETVDETVDETETETEPETTREMGNAKLPSLRRIDEGENEAAKRGSLAGSNDLRKKKTLRWAAVHLAYDNEEMVKSCDDGGIGHSTYRKDSQTSQASWVRRKSSFFVKYFQQGKCKHGNNNRSAREIKILLSTLFLAFAFTLTWAPYVMTRLIITVWKDTNSLRLQMFASAGTVINCGLNPVIILLTRKEVRDILRRKFSRRSISVLPINSWKSERK